jgi:hypothetical protein
MDEATKTSEVNNNSNVSASKRSVLKAAWIAPLVVVVTLPRSGYAANVSSAHSSSNRKPDKEDHKDHVHLNRK